MKITKEVVLKMADLANLEFKDDQIDQFKEELVSILKYVEKLNEVETKDVKPTEHIMKLTNVFREDKVEESMELEDVLKNAKDSKDGYFFVPKIMN